MTLGKKIPVQEVRPDFVPKAAYIDPAYVALEKERLWPKVWQVACREEELPDIGSYVTYDIVNESIIVVRTADGIQAFHNVCQHRGRRLTEGCGKTNQFRCRYHGWRWNLDGSLGAVLDHSDWDGCPSMEAEDLKLPSVLVDTWAGYVFVNLDPDAEPLAEYLDPVPSLIDPYEFQHMRFRWYKSVRLPCNWKVAQEAFTEGYHVATTHSQLLDNQGDDQTRSFAFGKHGMFLNTYAEAPLGAPSPRTGKPVPKDLRPGLLAFYEQLERELKAITSPRSVEAAARILDEVPEDADPYTVIGHAMAFQKEAAEASGAGWPQITPEQMARAGVDWHVFPNLVFLMSPDGLLSYRARPDGDNPDSCIFDIWSLVRYAPGEEPPLERQFFHGVNDWKANPVEHFGLILSQDFQNMEHVQQGMKSSGFKGSRTNPLQETSIANFHETLLEYLFSTKGGANATPQGEQPS